MHRIDGPGATVDNHFTEGDPVGGIPATVVTADWLNATQEELMSILAAAGVAPDKAKQNQLLESIGGLIRTQNLTAYTTAGTAPAFTLTPSPAIGAYVANQRFRVKFNAGAVNGTLDVSGKGAKNLKQYDSTGNKVAALIVANMISDVEYDGVDFVVLNALRAINQATESAIGGGAIATQSQTDAGTDDATIVTPKKLRFGIAANLASNGYLTFPSWMGGFTIQWMTATSVGTSGTNLNASWPLALVSAPWAVVGTALTASAGIFFRLVAKSNTGFTGNVGTYNSNNDAIPIMIILVGK